MNTIILVNLLCCVPCTSVTWWHNIDITEIMPFTDEEKHFIKILRKEKRYSSRKFIREFPNKNWSCRDLDHLTVGTSTVNRSPHRHSSRCRDLDHLTVILLPSDQEDWRIWFDCAKVRKWQTTNCKSRRQHRCCRWSGRVRWTDRRLTAVLDRSVVKLVYDTHLFITSLSRIYD